MSETLFLVVVFFCLCLVSADISPPSFTRYASPGISNLPTNNVIRYVSIVDGNDNNSGDSIQSAWKSISHATANAVAGTTVYVRGGIYGERVVFNKSGSANAWIIFTNYGFETPIIDGINLTVASSGNDALVTFNSGTAYIALIGFEIRNFITSTDTCLPLGIWICSLGSSSIHDILLRNNSIHHIQNLGTSQSTNAFGVAVYGKSSIPIERITFDFNEVYATITGQSETVTFNGNVDGFYVAFNYIHDTNNIGLDAIGGEGTSSVNDVARNGIFYGNIVSDISAMNNPTYESNSISADGIYVDGGANILIDNNILVVNDIGIEIASEHSGHGAINCTAQNNIIWGSRQTGITIGGYDNKRGYATNITIKNNILWNNNYDSAGTGEINFSYDIRGLQINQNTIYNSDVNKSGAAIFISSPFTVESGIILNDNIYQSPSGLAQMWQYLTQSYSTLSAFQTAVGSGAGNVAQTVTVNGVCGLLASGQCVNALPQPVCPTTGSATTTVPVSTTVITTIAATTTSTAATVISSGTSATTAALISSSSSNSISTTSVSTTTIATTTSAATTTSSVVAIWVTLVAAVGFLV